MKRRPLRIVPGVYTRSTAQQQLEHGVASSVHERRGTIAILGVDIRTAVQQLSAALKVTVSCSNVQSCPLAIMTPSFGTLNSNFSDAMPDSLLVVFLTNSRSPFAHASSMRRRMSAEIAIGFPSTFRDSAVATAERSRLQQVQFFGSNDFSGCRWRGLREPRLARVCLSESNVRGTPPGHAPPCSGRRRRQSPSRRGDYNVAPAALSPQPSKSRGFAAVEGRSTY